MADEKKPSEVVDPQDATKHGYWGYQPVEKDRKDYTVEVQGPIAEEAAQGGARAEGVGTVDKSAGEKQAVRRPVSKENGK
jgi:hypothetical protein